MGLKEERRRNSKRRLFRRDGWQDVDGEWSVMCAFGCGDAISWHEATIDLYPVKACDGGRYTFDNTRLVCRPCKAAGCNHKTLPTRRKRKSTARRRPYFPAPQPVSVSANIDRLEQLNARAAARRELEAAGGDA